MQLCTKHYSVEIPDQRIREAETIVQAAMTNAESVKKWPKVDRTLKVGQFIILCRESRKITLFTIGVIASTTEGILMIKPEGEHGRESYSAWSTLNGVRYCSVP